jgi:hypothetical protein
MQLFKNLSSGVRLHLAVPEEEIKTLLKTSTGTWEADKSLVSHKDAKNA